MGRKGVSKRKPKKSRTNTGIGGSSNAHPGERSSVQSLVKDKGAPRNRNDQNPSNESNKNQIKR
jgi:hypothetical protein